MGIRSTIANWIAPQASQMPVRARVSDWDAVSPVIGGYGGMAAAGGVRNTLSGLGGTADKTESTYYEATIINSSAQLQTIYVQSWAARKYVDMPIDDMFIRGRRWLDSDDDDIEEYEQALEDLGIESAISRAMKSARLYGTAFCVIMSDEAPLTDEYDESRMKEGNLRSVLVFDRFDCDIKEWYSNPIHPKYGQPSVYEFQPSFNEELTSFEIHESRCIRFDGQRALSSNGWTHYYDRDWGVSELIAAMVEITHDASFAQAVAHLAQEASIPIVKIDALKEAMTGKPSPDEPTVEEIGAGINTAKSVFHTIFMDKNDEFDRIGVAFAGMSDLMDRFALRLAAMAGIPATRFLGRSPAGMNATGESDMRNYSIHVGAMQERMLRVPLKRLDSMVALSVGMDEAPEYEWLPLEDISEKEQAEVMDLRAKALVALMTAGALDENEVRERLGSIEFIGQLEEWDEDKLSEMRPPDPMEMMERQSELDGERDQAKEDKKPPKSDG